MAAGELRDCDDGPEQRPLPPLETLRVIGRWAANFSFDLVITHGPKGEYTRHLRHEEVFRAVFDLWRTGAIVSKSLWLFAYEDGHGSYLPKANRQCSPQDSSIFGGPGRKASDYSGDLRLPARQLGGANGSKRGGVLVFQFS